MTIPYTFILGHVDEQGRTRYYNSDSCSWFNLPHVASFHVFAGEIEARLKNNLLRPPSPGRYQLFRVDMTLTPLSFDASEISP